MSSKLFRALTAVLLSVAVATGVVAGSGAAAFAAAPALTFEYDWDFTVTSIAGAPVHASPNDAFRALYQCFNCIFPVQGAPAAFPGEGQNLPLQVCFVGSIGCRSAAVRSYARPSDNYIEYVAQPGHFDGAGSTVSFLFHTDSSGVLHLETVAYISSNPSVPTVISKPFANSTWSDYARNLGDWLYLHLCGSLTCPPSPSTWPQGTAATCSSMAATRCTAGTPSILDSSCVGGSQQWFNATDLNNVAIHYTYADDTRACMRVHYDTVSTNRDCTFWMYVPKKYASGTIVYGLWDSGGTKSYFSIDENNVDGWQPLFSATYITHIEWQDNDGVAAGTRYLGWGADNDHGIAQICL